MVEEQKELCRQEYRGWDVHAYSNEWSKVASAFANRRVSTQEWTDALVAIAERFARHRRVLATLVKMKQRANDATSTPNYVDPDLANISVAWLLVSTWSRVVETNDATTFDGFREVLEDVGDTCLQGDSHRLLAYFVGISGD